jgi:hypothetical protein
MLPTRAVGKVHDLCVGGLSAVIAAIDMALVVSRWVNVGVSPKRVAAVAALRLERAVSPASYSVSRARPRVSSWR